MYAHNVSQETLMTEICTAAVTYLRALFTCYDSAHVHFASHVIAFGGVKSADILLQRVTDNGNNNNNMITLNEHAEPRIQCSGAPLSTPSHNMVNGDGRHG